LKKGFRFSYRLRYPLQQRAGWGAASLKQPGMQPSGPADDSDLVHGLEDWGKYSRNGRISMNIGSGTDNSGTLGQNFSEKNSLVKL
jgi:hypothetical protein